MVLAIPEVSVSWMPQTYIRIVDPAKITADYE